MAYNVKTHQGPVYLLNYKKKGTLTIYVHTHYIFCSILDVFIHEKKTLVKCTTLHTASVIYYTNIQLKSIFITVIIIRYILKRRAARHPL